MTPLLFPRILALLATSQTKALIFVLSLAVLEQKSSLMEMGIGSGRLSSRLVQQQTKPSLQGFAGI